MMSRKGPWEGYRRKAKRRFARFFPPSFALARETSGYDADSTYDCVNMLIPLLKMSLHLFFQFFILNVTQLCCCIIVVVNNKRKGA